MSSLLTLAESLQRLSLNDSECALYSAVVLLSPDRPGIIHPKAVAQHQERVQDALRLLVIPFNLIHRSHCSLCAVSTGLFGGGDSPDI